MYFVISTDERVRKKIEGILSQGVKSSSKSSQFSQPSKNVEFNNIDIFNQEKKIGTIFSYHLNNYMNMIQVKILG